MFNILVYIDDDRYAEHKSHGLSLGLGFYTLLNAQIRVLSVA